MNKTAKQDGLPELGCICASVRRAARLVTQLYDEELRGQIEAAQFALLTALDQHPGVNQTALARALGLDKTTLSRNLRLLDKNGWVERGQGLRLTESGRKQLVAAQPKWKKAQERLRSSITASQWTAIQAALRDLTNVANNSLETTR
jgi:DNA-binding MarR family transcriptional regulator